MQFKVSRALLSGFILFLLLASPAYCQLQKKKITVSEYIQTYQSIAIEEMKEYKVPASVTLAQGILESANGNSDLAINANNHFGIKCHKEWKGPTYLKDDDAKNECFRVYNNPEESYRDHSLFLRTRERYAFLFDLDITDYQGWAHGLKKAGYATNPNYPKLLIKIIEENELYRFDLPLPEPVVINEHIVNYPEELRVTIGNDDFDAIPLGKQRKIHFNNRTKCVLAKKHDTPKGIADEMQMELWQILKYNDLQKTDTIKEGDIIYIKPKRKSSKTVHHIVQPNETMHSVAQFYGIKLKCLYRLNRMEPGSQPRQGQLLNLSKRKKKL